MLTFQNQVCCSTNKTQMKNKNKDHSLYIYKNKCAHMLTDEHKLVRKKKRKIDILFAEQENKEYNEVLH
jgi:hypothetical protein